MSLTGYNPATLSTYFSSGSYRHVALCISGSIHTLYLDGSAVAVNTNTGNIFSIYTSAIQNLYIGCAGDLSYGFTGIIDDFKIWNRALPVGDIKTIYYEGNSISSYLPLVSDTTDIGINPQTVTKVGSISFTNIAGRQCAYFNNSSGTYKDNYLYFNFKNSLKFTFSYWVYIVASTAADFTSCTILNPNFVSTTTVLSDYFDFRNNIMNFYVALPSQWTNTVNSANYTYGKWNHFVYSVDQTSYVSKLYINGTLSNTLTPSHQNPSRFPESSYIISLGRGATSGETRGLNGYISQFQYYTRILTSADIENLYFKFENPPSYTSDFTSVTTTIVTNTNISSSGTTFSGWTATLIENAILVFQDTYGLNFQDATPSASASGRCLCIRLGISPSNLDTYFTGSLSISRSIYLFAKYTYTLTFFIGTRTGVYYNSNNYFRGTVTNASNNSTPNPIFNINGMISTETLKTYTFTVPTSSNYTFSFISGSDVSIKDSTYILRNISIF